MTIARIGDRIVLRDECPVEDAERLLDLLRQPGWSTVDLDGCGRLHTAVVQVLLAAAPMVRGLPADPFARTWILGMLAAPPSARDATEDPREPL